MSVSIRDLRKLAEGSDSDALRCRLMLWKFDQPSYEEWSSLVESAISYEVTQIAQRKSDLEDLDEDALTAVLVIGLRSLGLKASSERINGNCDLTVSYAGDYIWLGEAKIFTGVAHVWGGYLQLTARYATGMPTQNRGGMLLYCQKSSAAPLLSEWRATLRSSVSDANDKDGPLPLTFSSSDVCESSGLPLSLLHYAFPLYHSPKEDVIKLSAEALREGRAAKKQACVRAATSKEDQQSDESR